MLAILADRGGRSQADSVSCERERGIPGPKRRQRFERFCEGKIDLVQLEPGIDLQGRLLAHDAAQLSLDRFAESFSKGVESPGLERQSCGHRMPAIAKQ